MWLELVHIIKWSNMKADLALFYGCNLYKRNGD